MADGIKLEDLKELVVQLGKNIEGIKETLAEDRNTNQIYLTNLIEMLNPSTGAYVPLLPVEQEIHNFRSHRNEYFDRHDKYLDGINENYEKISEYFDKKLA